MKSSSPSAADADATFLLIDAGNSCVKWAVVDASGARITLGSFAHAHSLPHTSLPALPIPLAPHWSAVPHPHSIWISNVAGAAVAQRLDTLINQHWPRAARHIISAQPYQCGVTNLYQQPKQLGSDRWAGLIGAHAAYPNEALLIATLGTATTLESLDANGTFTGGLIAASANLMMQALGQYTAQLPTLSPAAASATPHSSNLSTRFARETKAAVSEGCLLAQVALIERAWRDLAQQLNATPRCVLSGGNAPDIAQRLTIPYTYHEHLVLSGLALIARDTTCCV